MLLLTLSCSVELVRHLQTDVEKFVRHLCRLVLRHQMPVWNYFVNSFYSVAPVKLQIEQGLIVFFYN